VTSAVPETPTARRPDPDRPRLPWPVLALALIAVAFFVLPVIGLLWRVPWTDVADVLGRPAVGEALWLSVRTSTAAALASLVLGVPLAWLLARIEFRGRSAMRALVTLAMVLPPVVAGVALLYAFGRRGVFGQYLDEWFGITLPFSTPGVVLAQLFVSMPFLVVTVESALRQTDLRVEDAARTLGATRWYVFTRVTLPAIRPGLVAGVVLAWARALGEFGATITFAGNFPGRTQTLPLATYLALETDPDEALVIALLLMGGSFAVLVGLRDRWLDATRGVAR
jgi:molybdate transport system permease protein